LQYEEDINVKIFLHKRYSDIIDEIDIEEINIGIRNTN